MDTDGNVTAKTYVASVELDSLQWVETTSLPSPRAFGAAFAAGNMMYYLGGTDNGGNVDTIYYTYISKEDGTLGFPSSIKFWETNPVPLLFGVSHAGYVVHDGRIFLLGGITDSGIADTILQARVNDKSLIGQWYRSSESLPKALYDVGATVRTTSNSDREIVVSGGMQTGNTVSARVYSYPLGENGWLGSSQTLPDLPKSLTSAVLVSNKQDLFALGGYDQALATSTDVFSLD
jgi:hypothetical protein